MPSSVLSLQRFGSGAPARAVATTLIAALILSGCATASQRAAKEQCSSPTSALSAAEMQLCKDADTFNDTVAGGAVAGAVAGLLIGALAGAMTGDSRNIARGALIGGVAGGIAGGVDGYITAKAQEQSNNRMRMVDAMTRDVEADNRKLKGLVASSSKVLEDSRTRLAQTSAEYKAGKATVAQLEGERTRLENNKALMESSLENLRKRRDNYKVASAKVGGNGVSTTDFDRKIEELNTQIAQLEQNVGGMNAALTISKV